MPRAWGCIMCLAAFATVPAGAGEIPGLPPQLPPQLDRALEVTFSNDFLGRGGSVDDFRTQQFILRAEISDKWIALLDHSILTLSNSPTPGRVDQLSASLGYQMIDSVNDQMASKFVAGVGVRSSGDFAGQRMQNGFHRLVGSTIENLPYTDTSRTDATAWFDAGHYRTFGGPGEAGLVGKWRTGYWVRASSLATSGGQLDASAGLFVVASRPAIELWFGLRRDWRSGYDAPVLRETAAAEDDLAIVLGARFGALVLETVQQVNNEASYGQLRLVSTGIRTSTAGNHTARLGMEASFLLPNVQLRLAGRYRGRIFTTQDSLWRETVVVAASWGEPQYKDNTNIFVQSWQIEIGLDFERPVSEQHDWLGAYATAGAGWRNERLIGIDSLAGKTSETAGRAVLSVGTGLRIDAASLGEQWNFRIQIGLIGRLPLSNADLQIGTMVLGVQKPALDFMIGMTFDFG